jgi:hypothetical protein
MESGKGFGITKLHPLAFVVNQILIRGLEQLGEEAIVLSCDAARSCSSRLIESVTFVPTTT